MARATYEVAVPRPGEPRFQIEERDEDGNWVRDAQPGESVVLDDAVVNVTALIQSGLVKPKTATKTEPKPKD